MLGQLRLTLANAIDSDSAVVPTPLPHIDEVHGVSKHALYALERNMRCLFDEIRYQHWHKLFIVS